jgi:hypothetical protein
MNPQWLDSTDGDLVTLGVNGGLDVVVGGNVLVHKEAEASVNANATSAAVAPEIA